MAKQDIKQKVLKWCKEENIFKEDREDPNAKFNIGINFPENIPHGMNVIQPKEREDRILILCGTSVSPGHIEKMKSTAKKELDEFLWDLRFTLGSKAAEFELRFSDGIPDLILITAPIYSDGLTKDKFMATLREVYKSKLFAVWKIQQKFGEI